MPDLGNGWWGWCSFVNGRYEFIRKECNVLHYYGIDEKRLRLTAATPPIPLVVKKHSGKGFLLIF